MFQVSLNGSVVCVAPHGEASALAYAMRLEGLRARVSRFRGTARPKYSCFEVAWCKFQDYVASQVMQW